MISSSFLYSSVETVKNFFYTKDSDKKVNELLHAIDESSIVAFTDTKGNINHVNDKFCEISGYSRSELIGKNHRIINSGLHTNDFFAEMWKSVKKGKVWKGEIRNKAKDGSFYWVFTTIIPVYDQGKINEYLSIRYDITEKKQLEEKIDSAELENIKSKINQEAGERFVTSLTHDMRTPLTVARLSAQLIEKNINNAEAVTKYLQKLVLNLNRADEMITDLLNATKIRAGQKLTLKLEDCDAEEIISKTLEELSGIHGARFNFLVNGDSHGQWSGSGIKRIIENLCNNAVKYGNADSQIIVELKSDDKGIEISVNNKGKIIGTAEIKNLFDYLQRTVTAEQSDKKGWGIGLTIVKGIAESHNGNVEVTSNIIEGTTFKVHLPK